MDYKLALALKDAGFPQEVKMGFVCAVPGSIIGETETYYPPLSELIEACGDRFSSLVKKNGGWEANSTYFVDEGTGVVDCHNWIGSTPEEAIANLYLALHEN